MLGDKRVLVVVPARGGSRGVPLKNIHPLAGRPLIAYTGDVVNALKCVDRAIVSTDDRRIGEVGMESNLAFLPRPPELSGDSVGDFPVLHHVLTTMEQWYHQPYDIVVMLQPTCPLRKPEHVMAALDMLLMGWDAVWTVSRIDLKYHPHKQLRLANGLSHFTEVGTLFPTRQELTPTYYRNGAAYVFTRECLLDQKTIMGKRTGAVEIFEPLVNIDTLDDFAEAERLMVHFDTFPEPWREDNREHC